jgi:hypothetical protein
VRHPVRLQRLKALEVQERMRVRGGGRIALAHGPKVGPNGLADLRRRSERLVDHFADQHLGEAWTAKLACQVKAKRVFERVVLEDRCVEEAGQD